MIKNLFFYFQACTVFSLIISRVWTTICCCLHSETKSVKVKSKDQYVQSFGVQVSHQKSSLVYTQCCLKKSAIMLFSYFLLIWTE